jgi:voltage-gated potassium channel Kch
MEKQGGGRPPGTSQKAVGSARIDVVPLSRARSDGSGSPRGGSKRQLITSLANAYQSIASAQAGGDPTHPLNPSGPARSHRNPHGLKVVPEPDFPERAKQSPAKLDTALLVAMAGGERVQVDHSPTTSRAPSLWGSGPPKLTAEDIDAAHAALLRYNLREEARLQEKLEQHQERVRIRRQKAQGTWHEQAKAKSDMARSQRRIVDAPSPPVRQEGCCRTERIRAILQLVSCCQAVAMPGQCRGAQWFDDRTGSKESRFMSALIVVVIFINVFSMVIQTEPVVLRSAGSAQIFFVIEAVCAAFFTLELLIRLYIAESLKEWRRDCLNVIDVLAVLPFYLELLVTRLSPTHSSASLVFTFLRLFRVLRITRLLKLSRFFRSARQFVEVLLRSARSIGVMSFFIALFAVVVATLVTTIEESYGAPTAAYKANKLESVPAAAYWSMTTISTVGYGDVVPFTPLAKLVGAITALGGLVLVSLAINIITSQFTSLLQEEDFLSDIQHRRDIARRFQARFGLTRAASANYVLSMIREEQLAEMSGLPIVGESGEWLGYPSALERAVEMRRAKSCDDFVQARHRAERPLVGDPGWEDAWEDRIAPKGSHRRRASTELSAFLMGERQALKPPPQHRPSQLPDQLPSVLGGTLAGAERVAQADLMTRSKRAMSLRSLRGSHESQSDGNPQKSSGSVPKSVRWLRRTRSSRRGNVSGSGPDASPDPGRPERSMSNAVGIGSPGLSPVMAAGVPPLQLAELPSLASPMVARQRAGRRSSAEISQSLVKSAREEHTRNMREQSREKLEQRVARLRALLVVLSRILDEAKEGRSLDGAAMVAAQMIGDSLYKASDSEVMSDESLPPELEGRAAIEGLAAKLTDLATIQRLHRKAHQASIDALMALSVLKDGEGGVGVGQATMVVASVASPKALAGAPRRTLQSASPEDLTLTRRRGSADHKYESRLAYSPLGAVVRAPRRGSQIQVREHGHHVARASFIAPGSRGSRRSSGRQVTGPRMSIAAEIERKMREADPTKAALYAEIIRKHQNLYAGDATYRTMPAESTQESSIPSGPMMQARVRRAKRASAAGSSSEQASHLPSSSEQPPTSAEPSIAVGSGLGLTDSPGPGSRASGDSERRKSLMLSRAEDILRETRAQSSPKDTHKTIVHELPNTPTQKKATNLPTPLATEAEALAQPLSSPRRQSPKAPPKKRSPKPPPPRPIATQTPAAAVEALFREEGADAQTPPVSKEVRFDAEAMSRAPLTAPAFLHARTTSTKASTGSLAIAASKEAARVAVNPLRSAKRDFLARLVGHNPLLVVVSDDYSLAARLSLQALLSLTADVRGIRADLIRVLEKGATDEELQHCIALIAAFEERMEEKVQSLLELVQTSFVAVGKRLDVPIPKTQLRVLGKAMNANIAVLEEGDAGQSEHSQTSSRRLDHSSQFRASNADAQSDASSHRHVTRVSHARMRPLEPGDLEVGSHGMEEATEALSGGLRSRQRRNSAEWISRALAPAPSETQRRPSVVRVRRASSRPATNT